LKQIVHKMHWLEDWGHELSNEREPLTAPEKHNQQPATNQIVSQPKETWIGNNSTLKDVGRDGNCGQDNTVCSEVKAVTPWSMDQWFLCICCCAVCLMEHNRGMMMRQGKDRQKQQQTQKRRHVATLLLKRRHDHLDHHGRHHRTTQMEDGGGRLLQHHWMLGAVGRDKTGYEQRNSNVAAATGTVLLINPTDATLWGVQLTLVCSTLVVNVGDARVPHRSCRSQQEGMSNRAGSIGRNDRSVGWCCVCWSCRSQWMSIKTAWTTRASTRCARRGKCKAWVA